MTESSSAPADTFSRTIRALERIEALRERVKDAHREQRAQLMKLLAARMALHRELFGELLRDYSDTFPTIDTKREWLDRWHYEGDNLCVEVCSSFRGEVHGRDIEFPRRYLGEQGEALMRDDAARLQQKRDAQKRAAESARVEAERARLRELMAKHPDIAQGDKA